MSNDRSDHGQETNAAVSAAGSGDRRAEARRLRIGFGIGSTDYCFVVDLEPGHAHGAAETRSVRGPHGWVRVIAERELVVEPTGEPTELPVTTADRIAWPSGRGDEFGSISAPFEDLERFVATHRDRLGTDREAFKLSEGPEKALLLSGRQTSPVTFSYNDEIAPGIAAIVADSEANASELKSRIEKLIGRDFEVRWSV